MKKRKVLKRRYKGAKVLHAKRYRPRRIESKRIIAMRRWWRNEIAGWGQWS